MSDLRKSAAFISNVPPGSPDGRADSLIFFVTLFNISHLFIRLQ